MRVECLKYLYFANRVVAAGGSLSKRNAWGGIMDGHLLGAEFGSPVDEESLSGLPFRCVSDNWRNGSSQDDSARISWILYATKIWTNSSDAVVDHWILYTQQQALNYYKISKSSGIVRTDNARQFSLQLWILLTFVCTCFVIAEKVVEIKLFWCWNNYLNIYVIEMLLRCIRIPNFRFLLETTHNMDFKIQCGLKICICCVFNWLMI